MSAEALKPDMGLRDILIGCALAVLTVMLRSVRFYYHFSEVVFYFGPNTHYTAWLYGIWPEYRDFFLVPRTPTPVALESSYSSYFQVHFTAWLSQLQVRYRLILFANWPVCHSVHYALQHLFHAHALADSEDARDSKSAVG